MSELTYLANNYPHVYMLCMKDPIMKSLMEGKISWGDIPMDKNDTEKDNKIIINTDNVTIVDNQTYIPPYNGIKTLIIRNLPRDISYQELYSVFITYGCIKDIYIPKNMNTTSKYYGTLKGFALIKFFSPDDARRAYIGLMNLVIRTNRCSIEFAKNDREQ